MYNVYRNISELVTLQGAFLKKGRNITEKDLSIVKDGALVTHKNKIVWVGESKKIPKVFKKCKEINLKGLSVLPSFLECHTHLVHAGNRADEFEMKFQGATYHDIAKQGGGIQKTVQATRKLNPYDLEKISQRRVDEFVKQGVTTIEIKSGYGLNFLNEVKILKVASRLKRARIVPTYLGPHAKPSEFKNYEDYIKQIIEKDLLKIRKLKYCNRVDIFIETGYFNVEQATRYFAKAKSLGFDIVAHTNQMNPSDGLKLAVSMGALSCDHMNYINDQDIKKIAESETTCTLIPTADFYVKTQYPPARKLLDSGARVALTTDFNPGTSPTQDIQFVGLLARKEMKMTLAEVINAWTVAPAFALKQEDQLGYLAPNTLADFTVMDCSYRDLFYQVGFNRVVSSYCDGKEIYKSGA